MKDKELENRLIELGGGELVGIFNNYEQEGETSKEKEKRLLRLTIKVASQRLNELEKYEQI